MIKIDYKLNHNSFKEFTQESCYWAGFLAADGHISKSVGKDSKPRYFSLGLKESDLSQMLKFKDFLQTDRELYKSRKDSFIGYNLTLTSKEICKDLFENFNIINNKSLILIPPFNIPTTNLIDCFIIGYIDGDGCIFMQDRKKRRKQKTLTISILGTLEMLEFIKNRFEEVLERKLGNIIVRKRPNDKNTFVLSICAKTAREIFSYFFIKPVPKLDRKWKSEIYEFCKNWKRNPSREAKNLILIENH